MTAKRASKFFYKSKMCTASVYVTKIKENFKEILINLGYKRICKAYPEQCEIGNVEVTCSSSSNRKGRSVNEAPATRNRRELTHTHEANVNFDTILGIPYDDPFNPTQTYQSLNAKMDEIEDQMKQDIKDGLFQLEVEGLDLEMEPESYQTGNTRLVCEDPRQAPTYDTFTCGEYSNPDPDPDPDP